MARRLSIPSKKIALKIVGPRDAFLASRIQRAEITSDTPTNDIDELGNPEHAGTTTGFTSISVPFSAFDTGVKIFSTLTGTDPTAYPSEGVSINSLSEVDGIFYIRDDDVADYAKSIHARKLRVQDFSFSYSVDGEATEDYTAVGIARRYFKNDVIVDKFITGTTSFTLSQTPIVLKNGDYCLSVILDGEYLTEVSSSPSAGEYSVSGTTLTTSDSRSNQLLAVYHADPSGTNWTDVSDADMPPAILGKDVGITISANSISRVQSVDINGSLNTSEVTEMGNREIVGFESQVPSIDGSITVLDTDTELVSLFTYGVVNSANTEYQLDAYAEKPNLELLIELRDPDDADAGVLKSVKVTGVEIVGDSYTAVVNESVQHTFNWKSISGNCWIYSGTV